MIAAILENWLVNTWFGVMLVTMSVAFICALRMMGFFEDDSNASPEERVRSTKDPWRVANLVESFRAATHKDWKRKEEDGNITTLSTEMDKEEALKLILEHRRQRATLLICFAALMAIMCAICFFELRQESAEGKPTKGAVEPCSCKH